MQLPLAMVLSDHGRCLSAASGANSISEHCEPRDVDCGAELRYQSEREMGSIRGMRGKYTHIYIYIL